MSDQVQSPSKARYFDSAGIIAIMRDRVVLATTGILLAIVVLAPVALPDLLGATVDSLWHTAPFMAASVLLAGVIKATGADAVIGQTLKGRRAIVTAAVFGAISPFCSCGVVPLIAALLAARVPLAPVMAFWLASPVIDPEMMILTWGVLGPEMAIAKTLAAIGLGLLGGAAVAMLQKGGALSDPLQPGLSTGCSTGCGTKAPERPVWRFWREPARVSLLRREAETMGWFLTKWLTLAFLLEAMMVRWVPIGELAASLADLGPWAIPSAALVGVPAYLNGYAAIPLVRGLMEVGVGPGAALAFMVAGGVTSIPAAMAVKALVRMPVFLLYLALALAGSIAAGFLYGAVAAWL